MKTNIYLDLNYRSSYRLFLFLVLVIGIFSGTQALSQPVINVPPGNTGALINAIDTANGNSNTIINLSDSTYVLTAVNNNTAGDTGLPAITSSMTINGNGAVIMRSGVAPQFRIMVANGGAGTTLTLNDLTLSNGDINGNGGGFSNENEMTVNMNNCRVIGNAATGGANGVNNDSTGTINIDSCIISDNDGGGDSGGVENGTDGNINITDSTISDNDSFDDRFDGGGVRNNSDGTINITRTTISNNTAGDLSVGGIWNNSAGTINLSESLVAGNEGVRGGGVNNNSNGIFNITNTTIKDNISAEQGGGVYSFSTGEINIDSSTIAGNTASSGQNIFDNDESTGSINIINSIVGEILNNENCEGMDIISLGFNIDSGDSCNFNNIGDFENTNPRLGPLADNGGPTLTCAPSLSSAAVNNGNPSCPPPNTDQRGFPRPQDGRCDIGAVEGVRPSTAIPTLSEWGLITTAGLLGIVGLMILNRRRNLNV